LFTINNNRHAENKFNYFKVLQQNADHAEGQKESLTRVVSRRTRKTRASLANNVHFRLVRQFKDPYVEKAKKENYRCRSSFKLLEINEKHKLLTYGSTVIDIGAAPGSWSQVCVKAVNSDGFDRTKARGIVIGLDRLPIYPLDGVTFFGNCDFTTKEARIKILTALNGAKANCVLSDMVSD
jgi:23S rRNA U2552 (ribose-2'-O)-methylase RlmE/FtsJ